MKAAAMRMATAEFKMISAIGSFLSKPAGHGHAVVVERNMRLIAPAR